MSKHPSKPTPGKPAKHLTAAEISPLLDILQDAANPAFPKALERLRELDLTTLDASETPALLARIQTVIMQLAEQKSLTAKQLATLRNGNKALKSYNSIR